MKKNKVEFTNTTEEKISSDGVSALICEVLEKECKSECTVSVVAVSQEEIHTLNLKYRGIDSPTDVLSFCFNEGEHIPLSEESENLGEIYISPDDIKQNASDFSQDFKTELKRVLIHGTLHLLGFDHPAESPQDCEMLVLQEKILSSETVLLINILK